MKHRKLLALLLAALFVGCLFAGCSADNSGMYAEGYMDATASGNDIYDTGSTGSVAVTDRKLIRRIGLKAETEDLDQLMTSIEQKVTALGGYMEDRQVYTGSTYASYEQRRYANLTIRIPAERLDEFVNHVEDVSNVTASTETAEDVTLKYVATESRMKALQAEENRLLALIDKAANLTELLQLESRLTQVRTELEEVTSMLKLYDNLVDYGTVELEITEVKVLTPTEEPGFGQRITEGFKESTENLWIFMKEFVIFIVCVVPYLLPPLIIGGAVLLIIKLSGRKKKPKKMPFPTENDPQ